MQVGQFEPDELASLAHDLGNVLQAVSSQAEMILCERNLQAAQERAREILQSATIGQKILRCALSTARAEPHGSVPIYVNAVLEEALRFVQSHSTCQNKKIRVELQLGETSLVCGDADDLFRVFANLLLNAYEALSDEGRIRVRTLQTATRVFVIIADNGPGLPPALRRRLFQERWTSKVGEHQGLGLLIASTLVRRHQGALFVKSPPHGGTTFVISFPRWAATHEEKILFSLPRTFASHGNAA